MEEVIKKVNDLQEGINCLRKLIDKNQSQLVTEMTDFKQELTEKHMVLKYDQAEAQSAATYKLHGELTEMLLQTKNEHRESINRRKEEITNALRSLRDLLETKINSKMKGIIVSSGVFIILLLFLSSGVISTRASLEATKDRTYGDMSIFKEQITKQLMDFKEAMRIEFSGKLIEIRSNKVEMTTLLRIHLREADLPVDIRKTRTE